MKMWKRSALVFLVGGVFWIIAIKTFGYSQAMEFISIAFLAISFPPFALWLAIPVFISKCPNCGKRVLADEQAGDEYRSHGTCCSCGALLNNPKP